MNKEKPDQSPVGSHVDQLVTWRKFHSMTANKFHLPRWTLEQGEEIAKARIAKQWRQSDLADRLSLAPDYISKIERAKVNPGRSLRQRIASVLSLDKNELLGLNDESEDSELPPSKTTVGTLLQEALERIQEDSDSVLKHLGPYELVEASPLFRGSSDAVKSAYRQQRMLLPRDPNRAFEVAMRKLLSLIQDERDGILDKSEVIAKLDAIADDDEGRK